MISKNQLKKTFDKTLKCSKKHCNQSDEVKAENYKLLKEYRECTTEKLKTKSKKKCVNKEWKQRNDEIFKCIKKNCGKEEDELTRLINRYEIEQHKIRKLLDECSNVKCSELQKEKQSIIDKCKNIKDIMKRYDCEDNNGFNNVTKNIIKCNKKKCSELHKKLSQNQKIFFQFLNYILKFKKKTDKENAKLYKKYYNNDGTLKNQQNKKTKTKKK
jgi:hypothetical protein